MGIGTIRVCDGIVAIYGYDSAITVNACDGSVAID
jgi:hypothetical protein